MDVSSLYPTKMTIDEDFDNDRELRFKRKFAEILNRKYGLNITVKRRIEPDEHKARWCYRRCRTDALRTVA